jgi:hypothetical protein
MRTVRRSHHVAVTERVTHADSDSLLPDTRVQEAGKIASAETLDHLLLETTNQLHLAEELDQQLTR